MVDLRTSQLTIVADENIPRVRETFGHLGLVHCYPGRAIASHHCEDADLLLVRSVTGVDRALLSGSRVRFVGSATIGTDHIDIEYLDQQGIAWANAPGSNADSVVDYVISAICRLEGALSQILNGAVVGIIGMGNVGGRLYRRLASLGIRCLAYDPLIDQTQNPGLVDLQTVLHADIICIHAPMTRTGPHPSFRMLDEAALSGLKPGTTLINAGRGAVVDNQALLRLLRERDDFGVVLDVWEGEPDIDLELMKRVDLATPHIAGYSYDGKLAGTRMIYDACCRFLQQQPQPVQGIAPVAEPLQIRSSDSLELTVRQTVLSAYDIAEDDQQMRGSMLHRQGESVGEVFDQLRREYPPRREFNQFSVVGTRGLPPETLRFLSGLGFRLLE